jgi:hypothetical protein
MKSLKNYNMATLDQILSKYKANNYQSSLSLGQPTDEPQQLQVQPRSPFQTTTPAVTSEDRFDFDTAIAGANKVATLFPGQDLGKAIGRSVEAFRQAATTGDFAPIERAARLNQEEMGRTVGDTAQAVLLPASLLLGAPSTLVGSAGQFGVLGGAAAGAETLQEGGTLAETRTATGKGLILGAGLGAGFNLLGKAGKFLAQKFGPKVASFTSGVPREAIAQAGKRPEAAQSGITRPLSEIRDDATQSTRTLIRELNDEFAKGLDEVASAPGRTIGAAQPQELGQSFVTNAKRALQFQGDDVLASQLDNIDLSKVDDLASLQDEAARALGDDVTNKVVQDWLKETADLFTVAGKRAVPTGVNQKVLNSVAGITDDMGIKINVIDDALTVDFSKSAVVKPGEQAAIREALETINTWDDLSPKGMNRLIQRIGELRNFDSQGVTRKSAIVGRLYNAVDDQIAQLYPDLGTLRKNFAANKEVLNAIDDIIKSGAKKPTQIQTSINKLGTVFNENREQYISIIRELSERSGVDYLSILAGNEFQKFLPDFVRGIGGGATISFGAQVFNPFVYLLAPLFSPRGVGTITTQAPAIADITTRVGRAALTRVAGETQAEDTIQEDEQEDQQ